MKSPSSAGRRLIASAGTRIAVLPLSGLAALLLARVVTGEYGVAAFAVFTLIANIPFLIPVSDLGLGAAVTNAAAALPLKQREYVAARRKAQRVLIGTGSAIATVSLGLGIAGLWPAVLGLDYSAATNWGAAGALVLFGASVPAALGQRELLGRKKNTLVVAIQGLTSPISLGAVALCVALDAPVGFALTLSISGLFITNWVCWIVARMDRETRAARRSVRRSTQTDYRAAVWATAVPMLIVSLALPVTFQSARLLISYLSSLDELAMYSAAAMVYLPTMSIVSIGGRSLWADFAEARARQESFFSLYKRATLISAAIGVMGAAGLIVAGPFIAAWATHYAVGTPLPLYIALGAVVVFQSLQSPAGMLLTDARGLRFQAVTTVIMGLVYLGLAIWLTPAMGAVGPAVAMAVALLLAQVTPCVIQAYRLARRSHLTLGRDRDNPSLAHERQ